MRYALILLSILYCSCYYFEKKRLDSQVLLKKELQAFKWNELDRYPSFENCEDGINFQANKTCFETVLTSHISKFLKTNVSIFLVPSKDTLVLDLLVSNSGEIFVKSLKSSSLTEDKKQSFIDTLTQSFSVLPTLYPAIKRSQQVEAVFQLPIILNTN